MPRNTGIRARAGVAFAALLLAAGCLTAESGGSAGSASLGTVPAYAITLPEFTAGVTTVGDLAARSILTATSPKVSLNVVWVDGGVIVQQSLADFKAAYSNWDKFLVKAWTPGFSMPTPTITMSNQYRLIVASLASKGGDVGVVIEPPAEGPKKRTP
ncbi:MAG: hypothetical protein FJ293_00500 [Planctomycetes bacterium]|nr:hypothetical protein [Planctomycetota bacterium]